MLEWRSRLETSISGTLDWTNSTHRKTLVTGICYHLTSLDIAETKNIKALISQRLLPAEDQPGLIPAMEILVNRYRPL